MAWASGRPARCARPPHARRHGNLFLAGQFRLPWRLFHLVAAAATAPSGTGDVEPDDFLVLALDGIRSRELRLGPVEGHQQHEEARSDVQADGARQRAAHPLRLSFEGELQLVGPQPFHLDGQVAELRTNTAGDSCGRI